MTRRTRAPRSLRPLSFGLACLALLTVVGCFKHPQVVSTGASCRSDDNCLVGYSCVADTCQRPGQDASTSPDASADLPRNEDAPTSPDSQAGAEVAVPDITVSGEDGAITATGGTTATGGSTATGGITTSGDVPIATGGTSGSGAGGMVSATGGVPSTGGIAVTTGGVAAGTGGQSMGGTTTVPSPECLQPPDPDNGSVSMPSLAVGAVAKYSCTLGYQLQGLSQRTCQANLSWSGTAPSCVLVDCGPLMAPTYGKVDAQGTNYLSSATYSCTGNTTLTGTAVRSCQADGTWSGTAATCECAGTICNGSCVDLQTDNANCGACSKACAAPSPSTAQCALARCVVALAYPAFPKGIAVNGTSVFWLEAMSGTVMKIPVSGGAPTTLATAPNGAQSSIADLAIDATNVYWTAGNDGTVTKVPIIGGPAVILAENENAATGIAVDGSNVYWSNGLSIKKIPIGGGAAVAIGSNANWTIAVDSASAYWSTPTGVMMGPLTGGTSTLLVPDKSKWCFAVDATNIYWTDPTAGTVTKMPLQGGTATPVASGVESPIDVAVDATNVYWIGGKTTYTVMKAPILGGAPTTLASGPGTSQRIVVDATSVYWSLTDVGAVMKVSPK